MCYYRGSFQTISVGYQIMFSGLDIESSGRENFFGFIIERRIGEVARSVSLLFERILVMALTLDWLVFMMGIVGMRPMAIGW
jgi:hypothetical protein